MEQAEAMECVVQEVADVTPEAVEATAAPEAMEDMEAAVEVMEAA